MTKTLVFEEYYTLLGIPSLAKYNFSWWNISRTVILRTTKVAETNLKMTHNLSKTYTFDMHQFCFLSSHFNIETGKTLWLHGCQSFMSNFREGEKNNFKKSNYFKSVPIIFSEIIFSRFYNEYIPFWNIYLTTNQTNLVHYKASCKRYFTKQLATNTILQPSK